MVLTLYFASAILHSKPAGYCVYPQMGGIADHTGGAEGIGHAQTCVTGRSRSCKHDRRSGRKQVKDERTRRSAKTHHHTKTGRQYEPPSGALALTSAARGKRRIGRSADATWSTQPPNKPIPSGMPTDRPLPQEPRVPCRTSSLGSTDLGADLSALNPSSFTGPRAVVESCPTGQETPSA